MLQKTENSSLKKSSRVATLPSQLLNNIFSKRTGYFYLSHCSFLHFLVGNILCAVASLVTTLLWTGTRVTTLEARTWLWTTLSTTQPGCTSAAMPRGR